LAALDATFITTRGRHGSLAARYPSALGATHLEQLHVGKLQGDILTCCAVRPFDWLVAEEHFRGAMVGMVYTQPAARGQGHAGALLSALVAQLAQQGYDFAVLWSGLEGFYQRLGWLPNDPGVLGSLAPTTTPPAAGTEDSHFSAGTVPGTEDTHFSAGTEDTHFSRPGTERPGTEDTHFSRPAATGDTHQPQLRTPIGHAATGDATGDTHFPQDTHRPAATEDTHFSDTTEDIHFSRPAATQDTHWPALEAIQQPSATQRVLRDAAAWRALPLPAPSCAVVSVSGPTPGYALVGEDDTTRYVYEVAGAPQSFPELWQRLQRGASRVWVNERLASDFQRWLVANTAVSWRPQTLAHWQLFSARAQRAAWREWHIPWFDRI
jgi:GNAT superfamily N-acetyltransferase